MDYIQEQENDVLKLQKLLLKSYVLGKKEKILFYLPYAFYFVDSISPLILRYIQSEKECVIVFPSVQNIVKHGKENVTKMVNIIEKWESIGARCYSEQSQEVYSNEYAICFLSSEYSGRLPLELRKISRFIVALQTTALYTHVYSNKGWFEETFSDEVREEVDYLVASEYIADWICERDKRWNEKILRFGYLKLDMIYYSLKNGVDIPEEWKRRAVGKKVILFTTWIIEMEDALLDFLADRANDCVAIWRPHPIVMATPEKRKKIEKISEIYNIIIDETMSYEAAFRLSDALIAPVNNSMMINYMYMDKPICIYDREEVYRDAAVDYRQEVWYKCVYTASEKKDIIEFIRMVERGEDLLWKEKEVYRKKIVKHFDGEVCNRIYDYFESRGKSENANIKL